MTSLSFLPCLEALLPWGVLYLIRVKHSSFATHDCKHGALTFSSISSKGDTPRCLLHNIQMIPICPPSVSSIVPPLSTWAVRKSHFLSCRSAWFHHSSAVMGRSWFCFFLPTPGAWAACGGTVSLSWPKSSGKWRNGFMRKQEIEKLFLPWEIWTRSVFPLCHLFWQDIFSTHATLGLGSSFFFSSSLSWRIWSVIFALFPPFLLCNFTNVSNSWKWHCDKFTFLFQLCHFSKVKKVSRSCKWKKGEMKGKGKEKITDFSCIHV